MTIHWKAVEDYFTVVLFEMLKKLSILDLALSGVKGLRHCCYCRKLKLEPQNSLTFQEKNISPFFKRIFEFQSRETTTDDSFMKQFLVSKLFGGV